MGQLSEQRAPKDERCRRRIARQDGEDLVAGQTVIGAAAVRGLTKFVGRSKEITALQEVFEKARSKGKSLNPYRLDKKVVFNPKHALTNQCTRIATARFYNGYTLTKKWVIVAAIASSQSRDSRIQAFKH